MHMFGSNHPKFPFLNYQFFPYAFLLNINSHHTLCLDIIIEVKIWEIPLHFFQHHACIDTHNHSTSDPILER
jgi:hypothetical protein